MAKIRTVKPELFRHEELFDAEQQSGLPLRLVFIGLFTTADASGRFRWKPKQLKLDIMPYDNIDFDAVLDALVAYGFIIKYEHNNQSYGYIPTWHKHQSINKREPDSRLPDPNTCTHMQNQDEQMHASLEMEVEMDMELEKEMDIATHDVSDVEKVFEHWKHVMDHPRALLDKHRRKYIRDALALGYDVASLCKAIDGCNQTPHNTGHNDRGERYDGLHIIFRSADQIDRFIKNADFPPRPHNKSEKRVHNNFNAAQTWLANNQAKDVDHEQS